MAVSILDRLAKKHCWELAATEASRRGLSLQDDRILEKPKSSEAAVQMLTSLSGRGHTVCTGVALIYRGAPDAAVCFHESTEVSFGDLSAAAIQEYVDSGEPMDKAGAYGIQGFAGAFVAQIRGCYHNVVGFPMHRFCREVDVERLRP